MPTVFLLIGLMATLVPTLSRADDAKIDMKRGALITWSDAGAPLGKFLLVRRGKEACALRFTNYYKGGDAKPSSIVSSGEESMHAEYDWFYQNDGTADFRGANVKGGNGKLSKLPLKGIGRLSFQNGNTRIECGSLTLEWMYPTRISFLASAKESAVELAPTNWDAVEQLDLQSSAVVWYSLDKSRDVRYIPAGKSKAESKGPGSN